MHSPSGFKHGAVAFSNGKLQFLRERTATCGRNDWLNRPIAGRWKKPSKRYTHWRIAKFEFRPPDEECAAVNFKSCHRFGAD